MIAFPLNGFEPDEIPTYLENDYLTKDDYIYFDRNGIILQSSIKYYKILNNKNYVDEYFIPNEDLKNGKDLINKNLIIASDRLKDLIKGNTQVKPEQKQALENKQKAQQKEEPIYKKTKKLKY